MAVSKEDAAAKVALVRELLRKGGLTQRQISERTGYGQGSISNIKTGRRRGTKSRAWGVPKSISLFTILGIVRARAGATCQRCDERRYLLARSGLCVECELLDMIRKGLAKVEEYNEASRNNGTSR